MAQLSDFSSKIGYRIHTAPVGGYLMVGDILHIDPTGGNAVNLWIDRSRNVPTPDGGALTGVFQNDRIEVDLPTGWELRLVLTAYGLDVSEEDPTGGGSGRTGGGSDKGRP